MKFPLITVKAVVDDIPSEFSKMSSMNKLSEGLMYHHAVECLRLIGVNTYAQSTAYLDIKGFHGHLPKSFYMAEDIWLCERIGDKKVNLVGNTLEEADRLYKRLSIIRPAKNAGDMRRIVKEYSVPAVSDQDLSYILRFPASIIRVSLRECVIQLNYLSLPYDDEGEIMMQDEEHHIQAVKFYVKMKLLEEDFYMQKVNINVWNDVNSKSEYYMGRAREYAKADSPADVQYFVQQMIHRYRQFKL